MSVSPLNAPAAPAAEQAPAAKAAEQAVGYGLAAHLDAQAPNIGILPEPATVPVQVDAAAELQSTGYRQMINESDGEPSIVGVKTEMSA